jgi:predicted dehydrogenase
MIMSKIIRWGILGTGRIAQDFAKGLQSLPDAKLWAIGSRNLATAEQFGHQFNISKTYANYESLVKDPDIDVVYIATPQERHKQDCLLCLNAGKPILCEKPFMLNAQEAREVITLAREKRLFCMEAMWMRFMPLVQRVKKSIDQGEIGTIRFLTADFGYPVPFDPKSRFFSQSGGGALGDRGIYLLSLAFYLLGEPNSVTSQALFGETGVDEQSSFILNYAQGQQALLFSTLKTYTTNEAMIIGDRGKIKLADPFYRPYQFSVTKYPDIITTGVEQKTHSQKKFIEALKQNSLIQSFLIKLKNFLAQKATKTIFSPPQGNGYHYEAIEVMQCLRNGQLESQIMPLDETVKIMEWMDKIRDQWH